MQLGWIDFSKEDRQKALDVINFLSEQRAVDELGIGIIRDAFANYFFPGTSTIQTSEVVVVGAGADAVDYKLISICHKGDIVVSQDYGVAAMALGKGAYAIHQSGKWYTNDNIDQMLMERHLNKKARRSSHKNHIKGPKKRTEEDDERFTQSFERLIQKALGNC